MTTRIIKAIAYPFLVIPLVLGPNPSFADGTYERPFSSDSIWNMPITDGAKYVPAGFSAKQQPIFGPEEIGIHKVNPGNPLRSVFQKTDAWGAQYCQDTIDASLQSFQVNLPNDFLVTTRQSNGIHVFVYPNGTVREAHLFQRCTTGSSAAMWADPSSLYPLDGDGIPFRGTQFGSQLPGLGGTIRAGELISAPGVPIPHALKLALTGNVLWGGTPNWQWPAKRGERGAGTNEYIKMGALFAIHPSETEQSLGLLTEPGKKIFHALQTYGGYVVDRTEVPNAPTQSWMLGVEIYSPTSRTVPIELFNTYGITIKFTMGPDQPSLNFKSDLDAIYERLMVVTNTSPENPKGPWTSTDSTPPTPPKGLKIQ